MATNEKEAYKTRLEFRHTKWSGFGEKHNCPEWAERLGLNRTVLWRYLKNGLTIEEVVEVRGIDYP